FFAVLVNGLYGVPMSPELRARLIAEGNFGQVVEMLKRAKANGIDEPTSRPFAVNHGRTDTLKAIVILADFSDNVGTAPVAHFDSILSSCGCYPTGSMRDYYLEISYGSVEFITTVAGWFRLPQPYTYYTNGNFGFGTYPMNAQKMAEDAVWAADSAVDFSEFDNDNDGYIDALFIVHAGPGAEVTGNVNHIWSHAWNTVNVPYVDSVYAWSYSTEPEDGRIGVFSHEAGHAIFGLPDLYDYDYDSEGVGLWSLMSTGSWNNSGRSPAHMDAYCKIVSGFVTPQVVTCNQDSVLIPNVTYNPVVYKLWTNGSPVTEYFLVENRLQSGFDNYLPWFGLMIYHVDETVPNNNHQWYPGYTSYGHYRVAVEQSDGLWQMEQNINAGNHGDPFPGIPNHRAFNDTTVPDTKDYNFASTHVAVENVSNSADTMTADFKVIPVGIEDMPEYWVDLSRFSVYPVIGRSEFKISMGALNRHPNLKLDIYDAAGRLMRSFDQITGGQITWDVKDYNDRRVAPGTYFVRLTVGDAVSSINMIEKVVIIY
ncbi:MAG: M6 family metalloprotease domain-containing protein, partial [candidate division WOR-3 bacterium]